MDLSNAIFESVGALFVFFSVVKAWRERRVSGVHWSTPAFMWGWGLWNLAWYPWVGAWWSTAAAVLMFVASSMWTFLVLRYGG